MRPVYQVGDKVFVVPGRGYPPLEYGRIYTVSSTAPERGTCKVHGADHASFWTWRFVLLPPAEEVVGSPYEIESMAGTAPLLPIVPCEGPIEVDGPPEPRQLRGIRIRLAK